MIYLILSILCASSLLIFFKLFEKYKINAVVAIGVNYITAAIIGFLFIRKPYYMNLEQPNWIFASIILGLFFTLVFNLSRFTTQKIGISITSVAMKLGVLFPVIFGIFLYNEKLVTINYIGILLGIISIYCINKSELSVDNQQNKYIYLLPFLVWLGSGFCDSSVQYVEKNFPYQTENGLFSFITFLSAAISSAFYIIALKLPVNIKDVLGGISLGIPNYFSIYFLVSALRILDLEYHLPSYKAFMFNNLSIVGVSVLFAIFLFREKLNRTNYIGIILAAISLILINCQ